MQINGRDFVAVYYEKDKEVGVAQVTYGNGKWLYGTIAVVGTRSCLLYTSPSPRDTR
mgnify:CR=1 FL=1